MPLLFVAAGRTDPIGTCFTKKPSAFIILSPAFLHRCRYTPLGKRMRGTYTNRLEVSALPGHLIKLL
jgi:hypothetical protein